MYVCVRERACVCMKKSAGWLMKFVCVCVYVCVCVCVCVCAHRGGALVRACVCAHAHTKLGVTMDSKGAFEVF